MRVFGLGSYFIADWEHWLGDWEHLEPMMQQLYSFLLFCCCDDKSIRATFKPSYVSKYMFGLCHRTPPRQSSTDPKPICHFDPLLCGFVYLAWFFYSCIPLRVTDANVKDVCMVKGTASISLWMKVLPFPAKIYQFEIFTSLSIKMWDNLQISPILSSIK